MKPINHTLEDKIENISNATINETLDIVTELLNYYSTSDLNILYIRKEASEKKRTTRMADKKEKYNYEDCCD